MVTIKSEREIELMREAGKILAKVHEELGKVVRPGISTKEIDRICEEMIRSYGCIPSFLGYEGYPASDEGSYRRLGPASRNAFLQQQHRIRHSHRFGCDDIHI